ncbi:hypothetical protein Pan44_36380 [Caulifigura coniformis]|uniref:Uncharacterized protein n=1 Tax=Caulifigura coniformis TaxID=2527983 RepID=A0A517SHJ5_9PLAN|nr:hypothetical protein [Caulifigura coniformis]QDT55592.1 hypothetical protein Pan44_36380 [Caulifigura coniformis]
MTTFAELVASRRAWLTEQLIPWCRVARRADLLRAEQEWTDIAGKVAPERSLWLWAWSRFPPLYVEGLGGLEESWPVRMELRDGSTLEGFPDNRASERGQLVIQTATGATPPVSIDEILTVERIA